MKYKFLHIPKTGGTIIKSTLIPNYKKHPAQKPFLSTKIPDFFISDHEQIYHKDNSKYIFFVRDPINRFISHYNFLKFNNQYDTHKYFTGPSMFKNIIGNDINKFILKSDSDLFKKFVNFHTRISHTLKNIDDETNNILMVGTTENLENDFKKMCELISYKNFIELNYKYSNRKPKNINTNITKESKEKLRYILNTEYKQIEKLVNLNFLESDYLDKINF